MNKNIALSRRPPGSKFPLTFRDKDGRPKGLYRKKWSRHAGSVVRTPHNISHRLLNWQSLSSEQQDALWNCLKVKIDYTFKFQIKFLKFSFFQDPFECADGTPIDSHRTALMGHAKQIWDRWRSDLHTKYIFIHNDNQPAILANPAPFYDPEDWKFICNAHYFSAKFKVRF